MATTVGTSTSSTSGTLSASGIGSGLDVNGIVSSLMAVENKALTALDTREASFKAKISAYGTVKSALARFQSALAALTRPGSLAAVNATSSAPASFTANAGAGAVAGTYAVTVSELAQAHKLASEGFSSTSDVVGTGTLTFEAGMFASGAFTPGAAGAKTVTIPAGRQTLAGIRDAVNAANVGVTATVVNDGSAAGNRLVFTSASTGAASSLRVSVTDDDGNGTDASGLSRLAYDPAAGAGQGRNLTQKVAAQDAKLVVDGIDITKPGNVVTDAIEGVTLTLLAPSTGAATLAVAADSAAPGKAVQDFAAAYNTLNATLRSLTKYDPTNRQASALTGDAGVRAIQTRLTSILTSAVPGLGAGAANTLGQAGLSLAADGSLTVDATKLAAAAASATGIGRLFAAIGAATDSLVAVAGTGASTVPGTYGVTVTQLATRGTLTGSSAASLTITAGVDDALDVTVDGVTASVTLPAGTYASADVLAAAVASRINGAPALATAGSRVGVAAAQGILTLTSERFGSASKITLAGTAAAALVGGAPVAATGTDVAGMIGGVAATGSGRTLRGAAGSPTEGLALTVSGGALGARGNVTFSRGYADSLDTALRDVLSSTGVMASATDGLNRSITDLASRRTALSRRLAQVEAQYRTQFTALDSTLSRMNATSTYLSQQLASLPKISGDR